MFYLTTPFLSTLGKYVVKFSTINWSWLCPIKEVINLTLSILHHLGLGHTNNGVGKSTLSTSQEVG